ncbi:hypothetical protein BJV77DRAFT_1075022 [Russula vinacea]|nr:hypothetical protein BJV77DRAFT_1075022 [Russula vinacea]
MQSDDSPQTVHFVPPPKELALLKSLAWQLALDHTVALSHTPPYRLVAIYRLQTPVLAKHKPHCCVNKQ